MPPSPQLFDIAALTGPIPGPNPAGAPVPYETRDRLEEMRREDNPDDFAPDDPKGPEQPKKADWAGITNLAIETLTGKSKDLLVAARLTEALVKRFQFAGLRDGLELLRRLVVDCWDRLHPSIEEGDLDVRAAPFNWLDVADRGAKFPYTVRSVPFIFAEGARYSLVDCQSILTGKGPVPREDLDKAIKKAQEGTLRQALEDLKQAEKNLNQLIDSLNDRWEKANKKADAPGMTGLQPAVKECLDLLNQIVAKREPVPPPPAANGPPEPSPPGLAPAPGPGVVGSRADAYRQLAQAAALLQRLEPHSPIPYLVERAVKLGALPFPEMIKALIRDANVLNELNRELGIKTEEPPPES
jgi:type VI secretion system protein ImpA